MCRSAAVTGPFTPVVVPDVVLELTRGACQTMSIQALKTSVVLVLATVAGFGVLTLSRHGKASAGVDGSTQIASSAETSQKKSEQRSEPAQVAVPNVGRNDLLQTSREKNQRIEKLLELRIDAEFPGGIALDKLLKHIKGETTKADPPGIPIYVSPVGLQETRHSIGEIVRINRKRLRIREILEVALDSMNPEALGLRFAVIDEFLMIDSRRDPRASH